MDSGGEMIWKAFGARDKGVFGKSSLILDYVCEADISSLSDEGDTTLTNPYTYSLPI